MNANKFVKKFGIGEAKRILHNARGCVSTCLWGEYEFNTDDLKRLVESHELVESVPRGYEGLKSCLDYCDPKFCLFHSERYKQAIADVESCNESN